MRNPMKELEKLWLQDGIAIGLKRGEKRGEKRGKIIGEKRGIKIGEYNRTVATIKNAMALGYSKEDIRKLLNLSYYSFSQIISKHFSPKDNSGSLKKGQRDQ